MYGPNRRNFLRAAGILSLFRKRMPAAEEVQDPWPKDKLIEPADLAHRLAGPGPHPVIISVVFPVLFRQRHIRSAILAGPASKPEGMTALRAVTAKLSKNEDIVIYCGCCPMVDCPNIRPAFRELRTLGYRNVKVLDLPSNFHSDWSAKDYPVEPA